MAWEGWVEYGGSELINIARTAQLAEAMGIDSVWVNPDEVSWIEADLGASGYNDVTQAPWYDAGFPASLEFAGIIPLSLQGLDDSTLTSTPIEYTGDGGNPGKARNATLPIVASAAIVAKSERGAEYGKRWLESRLRGGNTGVSMFCSGSDLRYFRYASSGSPQAHRRNVKTTRGLSVTRKRTTDCSSTWLVTFTWTDADSYEYGDEVQVVTDVGGPFPTVVSNLAVNGKPTSVVNWAVTNWGGGNGTANFDAALGAFYGTVTSAPTSSSYTQRYGLSTQEASRLPVIAGRTLYTRFEAMSTVDDNRAVAIDWFLTGGNVSSATSWLLNGFRQALPANEWVTFNMSAVVPDGAATASVAILFAGSAGPAAVIRPVGSSLYQRNLIVSYDPIPDDAIPDSGSIVLTQTPCAAYDYTPIYDPLYPALVPSPTPPNLLPGGWGIVDGMTFDRFWAKLDPIEPASLNVVPVITLTTDIEARMVRVSIWPSDSTTDDQCDPLFSAVIAYLPPNVQFIIDGEQKAAYVWDGISDYVRRADSLVYSPNADPVEWASFSDSGSMMITLDVFADSDGYQGNGDVRASLSFVPKSD